jgi:hypothetical protein
MSYEEAVDGTDLLLNHPFRMLIGGPSCSGKTRFLCKLLANIGDIVDISPEEIVFCYTINQHEYEHIRELTPTPIQWVKGLKNLNIDALCADKRPKLLIIDDVGLDNISQSLLRELYSVISHHSSTSIGLSTQNLFHRSKDFRTVSLNCDVIILFKSPRDISQVTYLARQIKPENWKFMVDAFGDATKQPYSYLFINLQPNTRDDLRFRTGVLPGEDGYVYLDN